MSTMVSNYPRYIKKTEIEFVVNKLSCYVLAAEQQHIVSCYYSVTDRYIICVKLLTNGQKRNLVTSYK